MNMFIIKRRLGALAFFSGSLVLVSLFAYWNFGLSVAGEGYEKHLLAARFGLGVSGLVFGISLLMRFAGCKWLLRVHEQWWHGRALTAMDATYAPLQADPLRSQKGNHSFLALLLVIILLASTAFMHLTNRPNAFELVRKGATAQLADLLAINPGASADKSKDGKTLLMVATAQGNKELAELLLQHGSDPNTTDPLGKTALAYAIQNAQLARLLLENGADANLACKEGDSLLSLAIRHKSPDVMKLLLNYGARPNVRDRYGDSPLLAVVKNGMDAVPLLVSGANPDTVDLLGQSPLHHAAKMNDVVAANALMEAGARSNLLSKQGWTALHMAAMHGSAPVAEKLLETGVEVDIGNERAQTPLHCAVFKGDLVMIRFLLERGADVHYRDPQGNSYLHYALSTHGGKGRGDAVVQALVAAGCDVNAKNNEGISCKTLLARYGIDGVPEEPGGRFKDR